MRNFLFIMLMIAMTVAPAMASQACASMEVDSQSMASDVVPATAGKEMSSMAAQDCDKQNNGDALGGCAAACALYCSGFNAALNIAPAESASFGYAPYAPPAIDSGMSTPSVLDPPPPRI